MADKVSVTLLKPLDGLEAGAKAEYDKSEVQALVDMGAVKATGFTAAVAVPYGISHAAEGDQKATAAPATKDLASAPRNKSRKG